VDRQGQVGEADGLEPIVAIIPTTVGILVVCGLPPGEAAALVEREARGALLDGMLGGRDAPVEVATRALERSSPPSVAADPSATPVELAVRALPWAERVATVATPVLGRTRLGVGRPEEVADALGVRRPGWERPATPDQPSVADLLAEAVERRTPPADPDLPDRLRRAEGRPSRAAALAVAGAALVALLVAIGLLVWSPWSDATDDTKAPEDLRIRQWVAVLETGPTPASLAGKAAELGKVAGVNVFTDRWECYEGFPGGQVGSDAWFLGIASVDRATVDRLVVESGRQPMLEAEVFQTCVQPPPSGFPAQP